MHKSDTKNILGGTIKGGANFNIDAKNNVYVNSGYYSKAPNFDANNSPSSKKSATLNALANDSLKEN